MQPDHDKLEYTLTHGNRTRALATQNQVSCRRRWQDVSREQMKPLKYSSVNYDIPLNTTELAAHRSQMPCFTTTTDSLLFAKLIE